MVNVYCKHTGLFKARGRVVLSTPEKFRILAGFGKGVREFSTENYEVR